MPLQDATLPSNLQKTVQLHDAPLPSNVQKTVPPKDASLPSNKLDIGGGFKQSKQIQIETERTKSVRGKDDEVHNETYCKEWVTNIGKVDQLEDPNITLAQGDDSSVETTSHGLSSLNITSVSRNKPPEYSEKFVSKQNKLKSTSLHKPADVENPVW